MVVLNLCFRAAQKASLPPQTAVDSSSKAEQGAGGRQFAPEETRQAFHRIPISDAIYLTADTDDTLDSLEPGKTYIIGALSTRTDTKVSAAPKPIDSVFGLQSCRCRRR